MKIEALVKNQIRRSSNSEKHCIKFQEYSTKDLLLYFQKDDQRDILLLRLWKLALEEVVVM